MSDPPTRPLAMVSAAVLTGARPGPAGSDAAHLVLGGVPNAVRIAKRLQRLFEDVMLVGADPPADAPGRRLADGAGPACVLRGLVSALEGAREERVLVVASNLPLVTPALLLALVAWPEADLVWPGGVEGRAPACGLYRRATALPAARERLASGRLALHDLARALDTAELGPDALAEIDPSGIALTRVGTQADLPRAEALLLNDRG